VPEITSIPFGFRETTFRRLNPLALAIMKLSLVKGALRKLAVTEYAIEKAGRCKVAVGSFQSFESDTIKYSTLQDSIPNLFSIQSDRRQVDLGACLGLLDPFFMLQGEISQLHSEIPFVGW
jgi:hypothetical protein